METLPKPPEADLHNKNLETLRSAELGVLLTDAYNGAVELDQRMSDIAVVPIDDPNEKRFAWATSKESTNNTTGQYEVHIRLDNLDDILAMYSEAIYKAPDSVAIIADSLNITPDQVTPQLMYVQSILHEMGHLTEHMDHEKQQATSNEKLETPKERRKREMAALPIGNVTVGQLIDPESKASRFVADRWEDISSHFGIASNDDLIALQGIAYRNLTSEQIADNFAADVFDMHPTLKQQLIYGNLDDYRNIPHVE
jgi:hypothetical protein